MQEFCFVGACMDNFDFFFVAHDFISVGFFAPGIEGTVRHIGFWKCRDLIVVDVNLLDTHGQSFDNTKLFKAADFCGKGELESFCNKFVCFNHFIFKHWCFIGKPHFFNGVGDREVTVEVADDMNVF